MNASPAIILVILTIAILGTGCTGSAPAPVPVTTTLSAPPTPVPEPTLYPGAMAPGTVVPFGIGGSNGTATVHGAQVRTEYVYTSAKFNSQAEQREAGGPLGTQYPYNTEHAPAGTQFVVVFIRLENTGQAVMVAPSPAEFLLNYNGSNYHYSPVDGPDIVTYNIPGSQYDYLIGPGGEAGRIIPGQSNAIDGFLIYVIPGTVELSRATLVVALDPQHTAVWRLA